MEEQRQRQQELFAEHQLPRHAEFSMGYVAPSGLDRVWPRVLEFLHKGTVKSLSGESIEGLVAEIVAGDTALFVIEDEASEVVGALGVKVEYNERGRLMEIAWLAGERYHEWARYALARSEELAKALGCFALRANCRRGVAKLLRESGFYERSVTLVKMYRDLH